VGVARNMQGRVSSEKLIFTQLLKKFPACYSLYPELDSSNPQLSILFS